MIDYKLVYQETWDYDIFCANCPFFKETIDYVPYGEGNVPHSTHTCEVDEISHCPGVIHAIETEEYNREMDADSILVE